MIIPFLSGVKKTRTQTSVMLGLSYGTFIILLDFIASSYTQTPCLSVRGSLQGLRCKVLARHWSKAPGHEPNIHLQSAADRRTFYTGSVPVYGVPVARFVSRSAIPTDKHTLMCSELVYLPKPNPRYRPVPPVQQPLSRRLHAGGVMTRIVINLPSTVTIHTLRVNYP